MNVFTQAARFKNRVRDFATVATVANTVATFDVDAAIQCHENVMWADFKDTAHIAYKMMHIMRDIGAEYGYTDKNLATHTFFITIRPRDGATKFDDFRELVAKFVTRRCVVEYTYSFEQKGTSDTDLGSGFHVHLVANMTQRSKGEVLRDTISTFKHIAASNCIDVQVCKNPREHVQRYLVDYVSDDNHKIATQHWDNVWRDTEMMQHLYTNCNAWRGALSSPSGPSISETD